MDGDSAPGRLRTRDGRGLVSTCPITVGQGTIVRSHMWRANREVIRTRAERERSRKDYDGRTYRLSRVRISTVYWIDPLAIASHDSSEGFRGRPRPCRRRPNGLFPGGGRVGSNGPCQAGLSVRRQTCH